MRWREAIEDDFLYAERNNIQMLEQEDEKIFLLIKR